MGGAGILPLGRCQVEMVGMFACDEKILIWEALECSGMMAFLVEG